MTTLIDTPPSPAPPARRKRPLWQELPLLLTLAVVLALLIKGFLVQAFSIPSGSMQHTLEVGDRVLVNKVVYHFRGIHRGEVVVFNGVNDWAGEGDVTPPRSTAGKVLHRIGVFVGVASDDKDYIKRVIGLPGDRVMCCSVRGNVVVQPARGAAVELHEPYLLDASDDQDSNKYFCAAGRDKQSCPPGSPGLLVQKGRLFVLGDHRGASADSRFHYTDAYHGTIPINRVVGRAFVIVWPPKRWSVLDVPPSFTAALAAPGAPYALGAVGALPVVALRRRLRRR